MFAARGFGAAERNTSAVETAGTARLILVHDSLGAVCAVDSHNSRTGQCCSQPKPDSLWGRKPYPAGTASMNARPVWSTAEAITPGRPRAGSRRPSTTSPESSATAQREISSATLPRRTISDVGLIGASPCARSRNCSAASWSDTGPLGHHQQPLPGQLRHAAGRFKLRPRIFRQIDGHQHGATRQLEAIDAVDDVKIVGRREQDGGLAGPRRTRTSDSSNIAWYGAILKHSAATVAWVSAVMLAATCSTFNPAPSAAANPAACSNTRGEVGPRLTAPITTGGTTHTTARAE